MVIQKLSYSIILLSVTCFIDSVPLWRVRYGACQIGAVLASSKFTEENSKFSTLTMSDTRNCGILECANLHLRQSGMMVRCHQLALYRPLSRMPLQSRTRLATLSGVKCSMSQCELCSTFPNLRVTNVIHNCDVLHITPDRVANLVLDDAIAAIQTSR